MDSLFIPNEQDFKRWIRESIRDYFENSTSKYPFQPDSLDHEPLLSRKEIAEIFKISLVTLHDWMKRGLPSHKQRGRVYFLRSEVMDYFKKKKREPLLDNIP